MTILRAPTGSNRTQIEGVGDAWATRTEQGLGGAGEDGADRANRVRHRGDLVLEDNPSLKFASDGEPVELQGKALLAPNSRSSSTTANRVSTVDHGTGDQREIRGNVGLQGLYSHGDGGGFVTSIRPGRPIEILSTARAGDLPKCWNAKQTYPHAPF